MKSDSNLCPDCGARSSPGRRLCPACAAPVVLDAKGSIEIWRLGEIRPTVLNGVVRTVSKSLGLPVMVQPSCLADWERARVTNQTIIFNFMQSRLSRN
jgi:hypothetical protein